MSLTIVEDPQAHCTMCKQFTYRIAWRPERDYVAGTRIEVRSHCLRAFLCWRYAAFRVQAGDITFRWKLDPDVSELPQNPDRVLFRARLADGVRRTDPIVLEMTLIPPVWAGVDNVLSIWTIGALDNSASDAPRDRAAKERGSECTLSAAAGPVERLSVYSRPMPGADGSVRTVLAPEDRFGNPSRFENGMQCELTWNGSPRELQLRGSEIVRLPAPMGVGRARLAVPTRGLSPRENVANGRREGDRLIVTGNPVWRDGANGRRAAFGEFHWHTYVSADGQRSVRDALLSARDCLNMDFAAPGDHNPPAAGWEETVDSLEEFNQPDDFATFFGWENGTEHGHENYCFTDACHPLVCGGAAGITGGRPDELVERLRELHKLHDFIAVPHHTNSVSETRRAADDSPYWHQYPWTCPEDYIRLVEIMQCRGNQELDVYDDAWRGWHQNNRASVQEALALGYKLGFVGGTDNHCGWPGRAFDECEGMGMRPLSSVILTGVWTPRVERQAVFDSLKARHTWAVWDTRALVHFAVNSAWAGDETTVCPGTELSAHIRLSAEDALQTVQLVSDRRVLWQSSFDELDVELTVALGPAEQSTYFYLRALQRNGGIIYVSPVFVTVQ